MERKASVSILDSSTIWEKILTSLSLHHTITAHGNNPYLVESNGRSAYFYVRNLTRAYPEHSPNVYRIQMHKSARLEAIKSSSFPLIAIGYCEQFNTLCTWPSNVVKPRLNGKGNISLYSRLSEMQHPDGGIKKFYLTNGDKISITTLNEVELLFLDAIQSAIPDNEELSHEDKLYLNIRDFLDDPSDIKAIQTTIEYFSSHGLDYNLIAIKQLIGKFRKRSI